jgi:hypothetical protein
VADLVITTLNGRVGLPDRWLPFLSRQVREVDGFVTVQRGENSYAQVFNDRGTLLLEYRDGSPQRHFQAAGVDLAAAAVGNRRAALRGGPRLGAADDMGRGVDERVRRRVIAWRYSRLTIDVPGRSTTHAVRCATAACLGSRVLVRSCPSWRTAS